MQQSAQFWSSQAYFEGALSGIIITAAVEPFP